jgi:hypothetical protein
MEGNDLSLYYGDVAQLHYRYQIPKILAIRFVWQVGT